MDSPASEPRAWRCETCGGHLCPPIVVAGFAVPADYVCLACGRPYWWKGTPPRLTTLALVTPVVQDEDEDEDD